MVYEMDRNGHIMAGESNEVLKVLRSSQYFNDLDKIENHLYFW